MGQWYGIGGGLSNSLRSCLYEYLAGGSTGGDMVFISRKMRPTDIILADHGGVLVLALRRRNLGVERKIAVVRLWNR
jgi:hypothetical protein